MAFQQGLSGLSIASKALDAISNNVANSGTVGFKQSAAQFSDVFAASLASGSSVQVGIGASIDKVSQQFTQGNITTTSNALDLAINGQGFFRMSDNGTISYSRNGQFQTDKNGFIVNSSGLHLTGKVADANGVLTGTTGDIKLNFSDASPSATTAANYNVNLDSRAATPSALAAAVVTGTAVPSLTVGASPANVLTITVDGAPTATSVTIAPSTYADVGSLVSAIQTAVDQTALKGRVKISSDSTGKISVTSARSGRLSDVTVGGAAATALNLPGTTATSSNSGFSTSDPTSYTSTTSQTVYDSLGNAHTQSLYFVKTAQSNVWDVYTSLDGGFPPEINPATGVHTPTTISFDANGVLQTPTSFATSYTISTGAVVPLDFTVELKGTTQFGNSYGVNQLSQDGYTTGKLSGLTVSADGTIQGNFSNGQSRVMGQVWLASFQNPNGLQSLGGNQWAVTNASGPEQPNAPGTGSLGVVQSAAVEDSNVDLTSELVNMITQQRAYQANAQSIKTQDQVLQTLVNLR
ncbi:MAG TPA: flagellar hook protein FlgE [Zoogloea sp.]|uniref:flagellar hook protein FlgE n=1 Tax=Zoogloea sp. TaxID=49181 RepID=UPI002CDC1450|nr:flagellar hook protein FlgE [Zoogloea sp.]HMV17673.1 flagellar hook protein FlgE [Rhodocyclaceae bacterium]HMV62920.1 flagellar hook protein FlgE [Rhodocyclaceae bacterium]HMW51460.1 flagellar hook protein FlgE [Rhodocyclaceae bacterium]HMY50048.1 flagellar hook protein FlgE [Rhodocyclaceae bacterium]HMZ76333.1 flagellar hook protein FlgE [Rhodocyclaceae bacterium]